MIQKAAYVALWTLGALSLLVWNQPEALMRLAVWIDRRLVRELRIRALALADSAVAYQRASRWHRSAANG
jgi:hypothetical protein